MQQIENNARKVETVYNHIPYFDLSFVTLTNKLDCAQWALACKKTNVPYIDDRDVIQWGPEAKVLGTILSRAWLLHSKELISGIKLAFKFGENEVTVDRKKLDKLFKTHANVGEKVWKDVEEKAARILQLTAKRSGLYFQRQYEDFVTKKAEKTLALTLPVVEKFLADAHVSQIKVFTTAYPGRVLQPEIFRLAELVEGNPQMRLVDKLHLAERINRVSNVTASYHNQLGDVEVGRVWSGVGLEMMTEHGVTEYMVVAQMDSPNKPCAVCQRLHGHTFSVMEARNKVWSTIGETDPDKLSELSPFPRVGDLDNKSPEEIRNGGYFPPFHGRCFVEGTEVYTNEGWKLFEDLIGNELFLSRTKAGAMEWVRAVRYVEYKYKGQIKRLHTNSFELGITPDHSQPYERRVDRGKNGRVWELFMEPIEEVVKHQEYRIPRTIEWEGEETCSIKEAMFLGWYIAEGNVSKVSDSTKWEYQIKIAQTAKIMEMTKDLMGVENWYIAKEALYAPISEERFLELKSYGEVAGLKRVPEKIKNGTKEIIDAFLSCFCKGDGSVKFTDWKEKGVKAQSMIFYTSSKRLADEIGELILKMGGYPSFSITSKAGSSMRCPRSGKTYYIKNDQWLVRWNKSKNVCSSHIIVEDDDYDGYVRDVELERNHVLWIRKNGKTCFSGNCRCDVVALWKGAVEAQTPMQQGIPYAPDADMVAEHRRMKMNVIVDRIGFESGLDMTREQAQKEAVKRVEGLQKYIEEKAANSKVYTRRSFNSFVHVMEDGRFKTQFETGRSGGCFNPELRSRIEKKIMGVPKNIDPKNRPVYGFLAENIDDAMAGGHPAKNYGEVLFEIDKAKVQARTTFNRGDSLDGWWTKTEESYTIPSPLTKPNALDALPFQSADDLRLYEEGLRLAGDSKYWECQFHGGLTIGDIKAIHIHHKPFEMLPVDKQVLIKNKVAKLGIKLEIE